MGKAEDLNPNYRDAADNHDLDHIPGKDGIPYFGRSLESVFRFEDLIAEHFNKWGTVSRIKMLHQRAVLVVGADNFQRICLDKDRVFSAEMGYEQSLGQFYKGGLLMRDFDDHKFQRRLMQTAFKTPAMRTYVAEMTPIMIKHLKSWNGVDPLVFGPAIKKALLEVGAKVFIGVPEGSPEMTKMNKAFLDISAGLLGQVRKEWPGTAYGRGKRGERYLAEYFASEIPKRRVNDGADYKDMLSHMCNERQEDGSYFDDKDIIAHASFLLFAAHDTTTSALNHMMYYTAKDPALQQRLREESQALGKTELEYEDLDALVGLDRTFHEAIRLHPPVPLMTRRTIAETEIDGVRIPANTMIFMPTIHNHRDPAFWSNPLEFDIDRFSPERAEHKNHSFGYSPFGGGAHKCIGMHFAVMLSKTFMHSMLQDFDYSLPTGFQVKFQWVPMPKPAKLPLHLKARS